MKQEIIKYKLNNGLTVVLNEFRQTPSIIAEASYHVGLCDEGKYIGSGIRHLIEHFMCKALNSPCIGRTSFDTSFIISSLYTTSSENFSCFMESYIKNLYDLIKFNLVETTVNNMGNHVCQQVIREINKIYSRKQNIILNLFLTKCFERHPYSVPVVGYISELKKLKKEDILGYYYDWFRIDNMVLTLAGAINIGKLISLIEKSLGSLSIKRKSHRGSTINNNMHHTTEICKCDIKTKLFQFGYRLPGIFSYEIHSVRIISELLLEHYKRFSNEQNIRALSVGLIEGYKASIWSVIYEFDKNANVNMVATFNHMEYLEISAVDILSIKKKLLQKLDQIYNHNMQRTKLLTTWAHAGAAKLNFYDWITEGIKSVTLKKVIQTFNKYFEKEKMIVVEI